MASITWAEVEVFAPELSEVEDDAQDLILEYVNSILNVSVLGGESAPQLKLARIYLAAHFGTGVGTGDSDDQEVASESMGGLTRSYVTSQTMSLGALNSTSYGRQYLQIVQQSVPRGPLVVD